MSSITLPDTLERVILICAANWSGSTMTGAVLGATEDGPLAHFHVGELHAYNNPKKAGRTYGNPRQTAKLTDFWSDITPRETGPELMAEIARKSGTKSYIDSSKLTAWFVPLAKVCAENNVSVKIVVSFRSFAAIAGSALSRGHSAEMAVRSCRRYMNIPRMLTQMEHDSVDAVLDTESFVRAPAAQTKRLCKLVDLPYFEGKEIYWKYPGAHLFGSKTQLNHMLDPDTGGYHPRPLKSRESLPSEVYDQLHDQGMFEMEDALRDGKFGPLV